MAHRLQTVMDSDKIVRTPAHLLFRCAETMSSWSWTPGRSWSSTLHLLCCERKEDYSEDWLMEALIGTSYIRWPGCKGFIPEKHRDSVVKLRKIVPKIVFWLANVVLIFVLLKMSLAVQRSL